MNYDYDTLVQRYLSARLARECAEMKFFPDDPPRRHALREEHAVLAAVIAHPEFRGLHPILRKAG